VVAISAHSPYHYLQAPQSEAIQAPGVLDLSKHRSHDGLAQGVDRLTGLRPQLPVPFALWHPDPGAQDPGMAWASGRAAAGWWRWQVSSPPSSQASRLEVLQQPASAIRYITLAGRCWLSGIPAWTAAAPRHWPGC